MIKEKQETISILQGIVKEENRYFKFRRIISEVSSLAGNPVFE